MMTQAQTQTRILAAPAVLAVTAAHMQLRARLLRTGEQRGSTSLEWAIIAAVAVLIAGVVSVKIINAVNTHVVHIH